MSNYVRVKQVQSTGEDLYKPGRTLIQIDSKMFLDSCSNFFKSWKS